MKRSAPLTRRTALKAGTKPLKRTAMKPGKGIAPKRQVRMTDGQVEKLLFGKARVGCLACIKNLHYSNLIEFGWARTKLPVEGHHIVAGGRRLGHDFVILLCTWHHQGEPLCGMGKKATAERCGPSIAIEKRRFVECYGTELDLLHWYNQLLKKVTDHGNEKAGIEA